MPETLYLIETRARREYICPACRGRIIRGARHFRHDPHPYARLFRGQPTTHWCRECIIASDANPKEQTTGRIRVPTVRVMGQTAPTEDAQLSLWAPLRVE